MEGLFAFVVLFGPAKTTLLACMSTAWCALALTVEEGATEEPVSRFPELGWLMIV
jgi:hypothetical protein